MDLASLFPAGPHRFHLTLARAEPREFFGPRAGGGALLEERARWLESDPARYAAETTEARPVVEEFLSMSGGWGGRPLGTAADMAEVGRAFEPDVLLLARGADGEFRLVAGALCFPTGWALTEKLGHPLEAIHGLVPGLNPALGGTIRQFLERLRPGAAYLRDNWGISAHPDLNQHPVRELAAPAPPVALDRLWLRVERQALVALPGSGGVLFGIRIENHRLDGLPPPAARALGRSLEEMPAELAAYKRLAGIRGELAGRLS